MEIKENNFHNILFCNFSSPSINAIPPQPPTVSLSLSLDRSIDRSSVKFHVTKKTVLKNFNQQYIYTCKVRWKNIYFIYS